MRRDIGSAVGSVRNEPADGNLLDGLLVTYVFYHNMLLISAIGCHADLLYIYFTEIFNNGRIYELGG